MIDPDEIVVFVAKKARQAGHTNAGPHRDQVFADVVQFAGYWTIAGDAEEPPLLRHVSKALIEGDELPPFGVGQMSIGPMRIEAENHFADLPRHATRFIRPHEPHGNVGFAATERNLLPFGGKRKPDIRIQGSEVRQLPSEKIRD
jgi:hypothetical protein